MPPKTEPRTPPPRASSPIKQTSDDIVQRILRGGYHNATFEGISQYTAEGVSASGLASMNAIRLAFELCSKMTDAKQLVSALISEEFVRKAMGIATHWPNDLHLEVDPILRLPLFSNSIRALDNQHAVCTSRTFFNIVTALRFDEKSPGPRAAHLTRPPEVIGVMHIPLHRSTSGVRASWRSCRQAESIYLVFDSHPRPDHPNGAAVQVLPSHSTNVVADYLMDLFQVDQEIMNDPDLEWTVQFLGQLSYHLLAPAPARETVDEYAMNMRILEGDRKCTRAEDRLKAAEATTRKLQAEIAKLYLQYRKARDEIQGLKAQLNRRSPPPKEDQRATGWFPSANRGGESSESKGKGREVPSGWQAGLAPRAESMFSSWFGDGGGREEISKPTEEIWGNPVGSRVGTSISPSASSSGASEFEPSPSSRVPPQPGPNYASVSSGASGRSNTHRGNAETEDTEAIRSLEYAMRLQRQSDDDTIKISTRGSTSNSKSIPLKGPRTRSVRPVRPIRPIRPIRLIRPTRPPTSATASSRAGGSLNNPSAPAPTEDLNAIRSPEPAMRLQGQFDEPVKSSMGESLARSTEKPTFNCGICMETFMEEAIVRIDGCGHSGCRDCVRGNIQSMIEGRRYPIPCPFCVAGSGDDNGQRRGVEIIPQCIVETIGILPELFDIYTELQLSVHSVKVYCRGCSSSAYVNREEYNQAECITCPKGCTHQWCKECSQTIQSGQKHTCDGSVELETLMNQQGWKHCPGCGTPIEEYTGSCNCMRCEVPGCNMTFCYKCGGVIRAGGTRWEIHEAVEIHYESCILFDLPPDI